MGTKINWQHCTRVFTRALRTAFDVAGMFRKVHTKPKFKLPKARACH